MSVTIEVDGLTLGEGTAYVIDVEGVGGLLDHPTVRTYDVPRGHADGTFLGSDFLAERLVTIPVTITGSSPQNALELLSELRAAWPQLDHDETVELSATLWGETFVLHGHTRDLTAEVSHLSSGIVRVLLVFTAGDPHMDEGS